MMALVDYRGFRLIAMSVLPLKKGSLIYGSCDAGFSSFSYSIFGPFVSFNFILLIFFSGRTVHADDKKFNEIMKQAGKKVGKQKITYFITNHYFPLFFSGTMLNLKPHIAGANPKKTVSLVSPADLEGHKGDFHFLSSHFRFYSLFHFIPSFLFLNISPSHRLR